MNNYYSTQSMLADRVAGIYGQNYVYVAKEFDLPNNDPSSNPKTVREWWCQVSIGQNVYLPGTTTDIWFDHKRKLKFYARKNAKEGLISSIKKRRIQIIVNKAQATDASPIVYIIPRGSIGAGRIFPGDPKPDFPGNEEYIIKDLKDSDHFTKDRTPCDQTLNVVVSP